MMPPIQTTEAPWFIVALLGVTCGLIEVLAPWVLPPPIEVHDAASWCWEQGTHLTSWSPQGFTCETLVEAE